MSVYATEFDFLKLLIGLDTAVSGALIYGQEHLLKFPHTRWLLISAVASFILSLFVCLRAFRVTVNADMVVQNIDRNVANWKAILPKEQLEVFEKFARVHSHHLLAAITTFQIGVILAFVFFVVNFKSPA
jgi:hypothetical protein